MLVVVKLLVSMWIMGQIMIEGGSVRFRRRGSAFERSVLAKRSLVDDDRNIRQHRGDAVPDWSARRLLPSHPHLRAVCSADSVQTIIFSCRVTYLPKPRQGQSSQTWTTTGSKKEKRNREGWEGRCDVRYSEGEEG